MKTISTVRTDYRYMALLMMLFSMAMLHWVSPAYGAGTTSTPKNAPDVSSPERKAAKVYFDNAKALQDEEKYREASKEYHQAVRADNTWAEAFSNLGYCYRKLGSYKKAVKYYNKAISIDPELAEAHEYLGEAYAEMKKFEKAEEHLKILQELGSDEASKLEAYIEKMKQEG